MGTWVNRVRDWTSSRFHVAQAMDAPSSLPAPEADFCDTVPAEDGPDAQPSLSDEALYALYFRRLIASPQDAGPDDADGLRGRGRRSTDWVKRLGACSHAGVSAARHLPRVPEVIPALLRSLRDEHTSDAVIARLVEQDVVLVADLLKEANSAFHASRQPVRRVSDAIALVGRRELRMLIARAAFRPVFSDDHGFLGLRSAARLRVQFEMCAMACRLLAIHARPSGGEDRDHASDAVLASLTQCAGWMLMFRLLDNQPVPTALPDTQAFWRALRIHAEAMAARIATHWAFPEHVVHAMATHRTGHGSHDLLKDLIHRADRMVKLRVLCDSGEWPLPTEAERSTWPRADVRCFEALRLPEALS